MNTMKDKLLFAAGLILLLLGVVSINAWQDAQLYNPQTVAGAPEASATPATIDLPTEQAAQALPEPTVRPTSPATYVPPVNLQTFTMTQMPVGGSNYFSLPSPTPTCVSAPTAPNSSGYGPTPNYCH